MEIPPTIKLENAQPETTGYGRVVEKTIPIRQEGANIHRDMEGPEWQLPGQVLAGEAVRIIEGITGLPSGGVLINEAFHVHPVLYPISAVPGTGSVGMVQSLRRHVASPSGATGSDCREFLDVGSVSIRVLQSLYPNYPGVVRLILLGNSPKHRTSRYGGPDEQKAFGLGNHSRGLTTTEILVGTIDTHRPTFTLALQSDGRTLQDDIDPSNPPSRTAVSWGPKLSAFAQASELIPIGDTGVSIPFTITLGYQIDQNGDVDAYATLGNLGHLGWVYGRERVEFDNLHSVMLSPRRQERGWEIFIGRQSSSNPNQLSWGSNNLVKGDSDLNNLKLAILSQQESVVNSVVDYSRRLVNLFNYLFAQQQLNDYITPFVVDSDGTISVLATTAERSLPDGPTSFLSLDPRRLFDLIRDGQLRGSS